MPTYAYTARSRNGNEVRGVLAGMDERAVRDQLRRKDLFVTTISTRRGEHEGGSLFRRKKVGLTDMVVMSRQLATLVRAGLPLVDSILTLAGQTDNPLL